MPAGLFTNRSVGDQSEIPQIGVSGSSTWCEVAVALVFESNISRLRPSRWNVGEGGKAGAVQKSDSVVYCYLPKPRRPARPDSLNGPLVSQGLSQHDHGPTNPFSPSSCHGASKTAVGKAINPGRGAVRAGREAAIVG